MADEGDDESWTGLYETGHWEWDNTNEELIFVSKFSTQEVDLTITAPKILTEIEFKELGLVEQMRFRQRYQRKVKPGEKDVITLQDVKDLVIYTAPLTIMTSQIIKMLHLATTERFIRALILYSQYYLEVTEKMEFRIFELKTKIRTPSCSETEDIYKDNLSDLRVLVAKEYCNIIIGARDMQEFHHMGSDKKSKSLSDKDARFFESFLKICVQIVWLALGRRSFNLLELEINRLFKSDIFNCVEHKLKTGFLSKKSCFERNVLLGNCIRHERKLNKRSPLTNEVFCYRHIDFRLMGLGTTNYKNLPLRLRYMMLALAGREENLTEQGVALGILGLPRSYFDTALNTLPNAFDSKFKSTESKSTAHRPSESSIKSTRSIKSTKSIKSVKSIKSQASSVKKIGGAVRFKIYIYEEIYLPLKESSEPQAPSFPEEDDPSAYHKCNMAQCQRWLLRLRRLQNPEQKCKKNSTS